ncbi:DUF2513 domain-containing protein [Apilactobacillus bombintestini]|uniref:DUF2513 domain-containing protein n=1 Tax=Apilactobacillus bombintestini TaxID=2419772 RepID=A0A387AT30_9LACO|nr:DUF2513 domain-containing protein [Apilactobacillus bombintestini]
MHKHGDYSRDEVVNVIEQLSKNNLITGNILWGSNKPVKIFPGQLTMDGQDFLNKIRDNNAWKKIKKCLYTIPNFSLKILENVAARTISNEIHRYY